MARNEDQIEQSIADNIRAESPTVDTEKGPVYNLLVRPLAPVVAARDARMERIERLVTLDIANVISQSEADALARTLAISVPNGRASRGTVLLYANQRPSDDVVVTRGAIVSTSDGGYLFFVSRNYSFSVDSIDSFYVESRRRYEFRVNIEATAVGADYDIAPERIRKLVTPISGIDGCVNLDRTRGGLDARSLDSTVLGVRTALLGLNPDGTGGIDRAIFDFDPDNVIAVMTVTPADGNIFRRRSSRACADSYVDGIDSEQDIVAFTAVGGEQTFVLSKMPVLSVDSVQVNGSNREFEFLPDASPETGGSGRAQDRIRLTTALNANDVLTISYTFNRLIYRLQTEVFDDENDGYFDTDVLVRQFRELPIEVSLDVQSAPRVSDDRVEQDVLEQLFAIVEGDGAGIELMPSAIEDLLRSRVSTVVTAKFLVFARVEGRTSEVETVQALRNQMPKISLDLLRLNVHK